MRAWVVLALIAACKYEPHLQGAGDDDDGTDGGKRDAAIDSPPPDAFDPACFGSGPFYFCLGSEPTAAKTVQGSISTTTCSQGEIVMVTGAPACVMAGTTVTVNGTSSVSGDKPLVLAATTTIRISMNNTLDASSVPGDAGPGSNATACNSTGIDGADATSGGGAGGSFGRNGGTGGGGALGTGAQTPPDTIRGGCRGGDGGSGTGGPGGAGGGAVYLVARTEIMIDGGIDVSGSGGHGGQISKGGGGGGGSGGMIVFHAPSVAIGNMARLIANGGGGGAGAGNGQTGTDGTNGGNGGVEVPSPGGPDLGGGTSQGGSGGAEDTEAGSGGTNASGAGGGGGVGVIRVLGGGDIAGIPDAAISPPPTN